MPLVPNLLYCKNLSDRTGMVLDRSNCDEIAQEKVESIKNETLTFSVLSMLIFLLIIMHKLQVGLKEFLGKFLRSKIYLLVSHM